MVWSLWSSTPSNNSSSNSQQIAEMNKKLKIEKEQAEADNSRLQSDKNRLETENKKLKKEKHNAQTEVDTHKKARSKSEADKKKAENRAEQLESSLVDVKEKSAQKDEEIKKKAIEIEAHQQILAKRGDKSCLQKVPWGFWMAVIVVILGIVVAVYQHQEHLHAQQRADHAIRLSLEKTKSEAEVQKQRMEQDHQKHNMAIQKDQLWFQNLTHMSFTVIAAFVFVYVARMCLEYWRHEAAQKRELELIQEERQLARLLIEESKSIKDDDKRMDFIKSFVAKEPLMSSPREALTDSPHSEAGSVRRISHAALESSGRIDCNQIRDDYSDSHRKGPSWTPNNRYGDGMGRTPQHGRG